MASQRNIRKARVNERKSPDWKLETLVWIFKQLEEKLRRKRRGGAIMMYAYYEHTAFSERSWTSIGNGGTT